MADGLRGAYPDGGVLQGAEAGRCAGAVAGRALRAVDPRLPGFSVHTQQLPECQRALNSGPE